mgnify:CR=1 FL=1
MTRLGSSTYLEHLRRESRRFRDVLSGCDPTACASYDEVNPAEACMASCQDVFIPRLAPGEAPLTPEDGGPTDFVLLGPDDTGAPGMVHLLGIESPGLTACLAIAEWVATRLETRTTVA